MIVPQAFKRLIFDVSRLYGAQLVAVAVSFIAAVIITRSLGPAGRGAYDWILTLQAFTVQIALLGLNIANQRLVVENKKEIGTIIGNSLALAFISSAVVLPLAYMWAIQHPIAQNHTSALLLSFIGTPLAVVGIGLTALFVHLNKVKALAFQNMAPRIIQVGLLTLVAYIAGLDVIHVIGFALFLVSMECALSLYFLREHLPSTRLDFSLIRKAWGYVAGMYIAWLAYFFMQKVDILMLGTMKSAAETGFYGVAATLGNIMLMLPAALGSILVTRFAEMKDDPDRRPFFYIILTALATLMGLGGLAAYLLAPWIIPLVFGAAFAASVAPFQILIPAVFCLSLYQVTQGHVYAHGRGRQIILAPLMGVVLNISLNWLWIPTYGATGAAWASLVAYASALALAWGLSLKKQAFA